MWRSIGNAAAVVIACVAADFCIANCASVTGLGSQHVSTLLLLNGRQIPTNLTQLEYYECVSPHCWMWHLRPVGHIERRCRRFTLTAARYAKLKANGHSCMPLVHSIDLIVCWQFVEKLPYCDRCFIRIANVPKPAQLSTIAMKSITATGSTNRGHCKLIKSSIASALVSRVRGFKLLFIRS